MSPSGTSCAPAPYDADTFLFDGGHADGIVKSCDFGLADTIEPHRPELFETYGAAPFMSPEMLEDKGYDTQTDVWRFAVIAYALLFGQFPFKTVDAYATCMGSALGTSEANALRHDCCAFYDDS